MDFVIASNIAVFLAWTSSAIFVLISLLCIGYMFALRGWTASVKARRDIVNDRWEEMLYDASVGDDGAKLIGGQEVYRLTTADKKDVLRTYIEKGRFDPFEPLPPADLPHFLYLWNYLHESLRGNSKDNLNELAANLQVDQKTYRMLRGRSLRNKILAINTFGNLRVTEAYDEIVKLTKHRDPIISLWAWRALLRIDFERTLKDHFSLIAARKDWSPTFVAKVLLECDQDLIAEPLVDLVRNEYENGLAERQLSRLVSYLGIVHIRSFSGLIHRILCESDRAEVLIACLRLVRAEESLPRVRELLKHERWEVRLQVVQTLGRLGHDEDVAILVECLNDLEWWVRYRAASALVVMPTTTTEQLDALVEKLPNEFARDMLRQVLAEKRITCFNPTQPSLLSK